jgi:SAM-dependent methyltransferase
MASGQARSTSSASGRSAYPDGVADWLVRGDEPKRRRRVLDIGSGRGGLAELMVALGHDVHCLDADQYAVRQLGGQLPTAKVIAGQVESMPFDACHFDVVTASQNLHAFAPGLALAEIARVLKPGGHLAVAYNTRDDTVPWVRKLIRMMQSADPDSMRGDYGADSIHSVEESAYFTEISYKGFRNWIPITRPGLLKMVSARPGTRQLSEASREKLLADVAALYAEYARVPEPLLLPFRASCWRAEVDHNELTVIETLDADALQISLQF